VDQVVLEKTCALLDRMKKDGLPLFPVSVNLSRRRMENAHLLEQLVSCVDKYGVSHDLIEFELTESAVYADEEEMLIFLSKLRELGFRISMDDFGTGYSNLSSVLQYPFSVVKLDRSLINTLPENKQAAMMVDALLQLFHNMNMRVVAEGVEEPVQADYLKSRGVDMIQGYYYARPMPESDLLSFLKK